MHATKRAFASTQLSGAVLAGLLALGGCASGPKNYEIKAVADPIVNRDVSGHPLSVVVHIYQLKEAGEFSKLTSDALASGRSLSELLAKDLLEVNEVMLVPGGTETRTDKIHQDAKHVGIIAFFRQPDQHYWRVLADAEQVRKTGLHFRVQDCFLSLASPKPTLIPGQPPATPTSCPGSDMRPAAAPGVTTGPTRQGSASPRPKRTGILETTKQAAEPFLSRKP
jgi:type VI secretion system protein VasD